MRRIAALVCCALWGSVASAQLPDEIERIDYLTFGRGALFVSQTGLASGSSGTAISAIDGDWRQMALMSDSTGPVEFVYRLPAPTTFDRFAIPNALERPGNTSFVKDVEVSGSSESADGPWETLATFSLEAHDEADQVTEQAPVAERAVLWVKVRFEGGLLIEEGDEGRTVLRFSELIGNGTQESTELSDAFDGLWALRLAERTDLKGHPFQLKQDGTTITGCYGDFRFQGTVNGVIARATGVDPSDRTVAFILVAEDDGTIRAAVSRNRGRFKSFVTVDVPDIEPPSCGVEEAEPVACNTDVYVNFDVNSATLRPESLPVLADVAQRLGEENPARVEIIGHTSTEGSTDYNQALSERRAEAVAKELVARGFDAAKIVSSGQGESSPLVRNDDTESARELNRRVHVRCE